MSKNNWLTNWANTWIFVGATEALVQNRLARMPVVQRVAVSLNMDTFRIVCCDEILRRYDARERGIR